MTTVLQPGEPAPQTGYFEELNAFGRPTGYVVHARKGEPLPFAPTRFTWRLASTDDDGAE
jgi:hypothetical protein